ncbi:MAG: DUF3106 domain-containing protein [Acidobacteriota bacterium]
MRRFTRIAAAFALWAIVAMAPAVAQIRPKGGFGFPKGPIGSGRNAAQFQMQLDRLQKMSPEERRKALDALPEGRREQFERRLEAYSHMTPSERERLARQLNNFQQLPPERQKAIRQMRKQLSEMPPRRRRLMAREVMELRGMSDEERQSRLDSPELKDRFSDEERQLLGDLSSVLEPEPEP